MINLSLGTVTIMQSIRDAEAAKAIENMVNDVNIIFVKDSAKLSDLLCLSVFDIFDQRNVLPKEFITSSLKYFGIGGAK